MPYKRNSRYYVQRQFPGVGRIYKSLQTENVTRARQLENMLQSLHRQGHLDLLNAFQEGEVEIHELAEAYESNRIHRLRDRLERGEIPTLREACDDYLRSVKPDVKPTTLDGYRAHLEHFQNVMGGDTPVDEALVGSQREDPIQDYKAECRDEGLAKETINNRLTPISGLCSRAVDQGWIEEKPEISTYSSSVRIRRLTPDEIRVYMATLRPAFRPLMQFLIGTGARLGEAEKLRVRHLRFGDEGAAGAEIPDAKSDHGVREIFVPSWVADELQEEIERRDLDGGSRLFTIPRRTVQKEHNKAAEAAGHSDYTVHDHRHTAAVLMAQAGMPLDRIRDQLGHGQIEQTMRYARYHPNYNDVAPYFEKIEERLGPATSHNKSDNTPQNNNPDSEERKPSESG